MRVIQKVLGLKEMDAALAEFAKATARSVANRALRKAAQPILEEARRLVPVDTGALQATIVATNRKPKGHASKAGYAAAKRQGATNAEAGAAQRAFNRENPGAFAEAFVVVNSPLAHFQEFGTARQAPQPFLRPAFENKKDEALALVATELKAEISKAAERARRKALRKATA